MEFQTQLQALRQQFADELARRDTQIATLQETVTALQTRNPSDTKRPKRQLPDPPKFDGTQLRYDTWLAQLQLVLSVDGDAIGNAQAQFAFVYLRLESSPAALCLELLKHANLTGKFDYQLIIDQLDRHNGVENKVQRAKAKLHKLVQSGSFHGFLISFEVTLGEAGGWSWDDDRKIDTLRPCLSDYLKRKLQEHDVSGTTPDKYLEFVSLCKCYASQPTSTAIVQGNTSGSAPNRQLYDHKADHMDLTVINTIDCNMPSSPHHSRSSSQSSSSIDRSRCYRCGAIDHYVSICPIQPKSETPPAPILQGQPGRKQTATRLQYDKVERKDLEEEIDFLGIETVLDAVYDYRLLHNMHTPDIGNDNNNFKDFFS